VSSFVFATSKSVQFGAGFLARLGEVARREIGGRASCSSPIPA
jgi:hypothetical protein